MWLKNVTHTKKNQLLKMPEDAWKKQKVLHKKECTTSLLQGGELNYSVLPNWNQPISEAHCTSWKVKQKQLLDLNEIPFIWSLCGLMFRTVFFVIKKLMKNADVINPFTNFCSWNLLFQINKVSGVLLVNKEFRLF